MSDSKKGLNTEIFVESFSSDSSEGFKYVTENYVNTQINNNLEKVRTMKLDITNGVSVIDSSLTSTLSTVTVGLSANLEDLSNVGTSTPVDGDLLRYNGTKWEPAKTISIPIYGDTGEASDIAGVSGNLAFFTNVAGVSYLGIAVGDGTSWYGISSSNFIS